MKNKQIRLSVALEDDLASALDWVGRELHVKRRALLVSALRAWSANPTLKPWQIKNGLIRRYVAITVSQSEMDLVRGWCDQLKVQPSQVVASALSYWFEECGFLDRVRQNQVKNSELETLDLHPRQMLPPDEDDLPLRKILERQLDYYRRSGNSLRVAQLSRQLKQLEDAA